MIFGIGNDIIDVKRIQALCDKFEFAFLKKIFSENEILQSEKSQDSNLKMNFFAKRFAAKEAFAKACGIGIGRGINFLDIEVQNDEFGKPYFNILNDKKDFLLQKFGADFNVFLSLSDEKDFAIAFVIIEKK